jgi:hypothetical protein
LDTIPIKVLHPIEIINEKDNKMLPFIDIMTSIEARKHMHVIESFIYSSLLDFGHERD